MEDALIEFAWDEGDLEETINCINAKGKVKDILKFFLVRPEGLVGQIYYDWDEGKKIFVYQREVQEYDC